MPSAWHVSGGRSVWRTSNRCATTLAYTEGLESNDDLECLPAWDIYAAALYW